ncbi:MAG: hypothetical protein E7505_01100 [Ruminococcus sp.]|nr:hypothetical protein [Ruminococcus sp.]
MQVGSSSDNTYTSSAYSNKGVSGMVSGLDTEGLVKSMLSDIQTKIDKQEQKQKVLEMQQEEYREVIDKINDFKDKYFSVAGEKSLVMSSTFKSSNTESSSAAVKAVSTSDAVEGSFDVEVIELATAAKFTSGVSASSGKSLTLAADSDLMNSSKKTITIGCGSDNISIDISGAINENDIVDRINKGIESYNKVNGTSIGISASLDSDKKIVYSGSEDDTVFTVDGNALTFNDVKASVESSKITPSKLSETAKDYKLKVNDQEITVSLSKDDTEDQIAEKLTDALSGLGVTVKNNDGKLKFEADTASKLTIEAADGAEDDFKALGFTAKAEGIRTSSATVDAPEIKTKGTLEMSFNGVTKSITITDTDTKDSFSEKLFNAFGSGVHFDPASGDITAGTGKNISIKGSKDALEYLGIDEKGVSNRVSVSDSLADIYDDIDEDSSISFTINDTTFNFKGTTSLADMMSEINDSRAGVTFTYNSLNDKFSIVSQEMGSGSAIKVTDGQGGIISKMFGVASIDEKGNDAKLNIDGEYVEYSGNEVSYNGINLTLKKVTDGPVNIETSRNTEKALDTIVSFVEDYNKLIEDLNKRIHEKPEYKKYAPLTSAQEDEMSESEIEKWNKKSKTGLLSGDSDISKFLSEMRTVLYTKVGDSKMLADIGIEASSDWKEYGKLKVDKEKLTDALQTDMKGVADIFTGSTGIANRLSNVCKKAANTSSGSPGSLVSLAGLKGKATEKNNTINKRIDSIKEMIEKLKAQYESRKERLWKQFNSMESALSGMNSTSNYLASMMGGGY